MSETKAIKEAVESYLESLGVKTEIQLRGDSCPPFCKDKGKRGLGEFPRKTHIHGQHYEMFVNRGEKYFSVHFWNSYHDAELKAIGHVKKIGNSVFVDRQFLTKTEREQIKVTVTDVLACCQLYDVGSFEDFCAEFGYDDDSGQAEQTYRAVCGQYKDFKRMFSGEELAKLAELSSDF